MPPVANGSRQKPKRRRNLSLEILFASIAIGIALFLLAIGALYLLGKKDDETGGSAGVRRSDGSQISTRQQNRVKEYLRKTERRHSITRLYPPESLLGAASYCDQGYAPAWLPIETQFAISRGYRGEWGNLQGQRAVYGVRVEYEVDEGFGRAAECDRVFLLNKDNLVLGSIPTRYVSIGKPGDAERQRQEQLDLKALFNP